ncbi:acid protease [Clavulina sp. PMI_390]|nr:acid protease [Clavulina sp. PMI_390]
MAGRWLGLPLLLSLSLSVFSPVNAYRTTIERRAIPPSAYAPSLARRFLSDDELAKRATAITQGDTNINDVQNSQYVANITIGGANFNVILDTGSSDLWVTGTIPNSSDTGTPASITYAIGDASGNVHLAPVTFSDFTVDQQAFIDVANSSSFGSIAALGINGLAGLGPGFSSVVRTTVGAPKGDTLLDNIFQLNKTTSNFITFLLGRSGITNVSSVGEFTISEIISGYENITNQPQISVQELSGSSLANQHWTVLADKMIGPDGNQISYSSIVSGTSKGEVVTVLDSGFTLPQVPRKVSDAIYGRVQGAEYDSTNGWWVLPCEQELNISFVLGGQTYPVHPLDAISSDYGGKFSNGTTGCVGTFQPITSGFSLSGQFDIILGEAFLRNTYNLFNWGDFVDDTAVSRNSPYVQMQSTTNMAVAHQQFVEMRMGGVDHTGDSQFKLLKNGQSSPVPESERIQHLEGFAYRHRVAIAAGTVGAFILLLLLSTCCFIRRRRARKQGGSRGGPAMMPLGSTANLHSYGGSNDYGNTYSAGYNKVHANSHADLQMGNMNGYRQGP